MSLLEKYAEVLAKMDEPTDVSIEENYAYWGVRLGSSLSKMFPAELPDVDKLQKLMDVMREFVPKIEKILEGE